MELIVTLGERQEKVEIQPRGSGFSVRIGERHYAVEASAVGGSLHSFLVRPEAEGRRQEHWEVSVRAREGGSYAVSSGGPRPVSTVEVTDPLTHRARQALGGGLRSGPQRVAAYMPGRVIAVLVEEGAEVAEGQGIVVLEAMKMENEIAAEGSGVLRKLLVAAGQTVDSGDPLFEID